MSKSTAESYPNKKMRVLLSLFISAILIACSDSSDRRSAVVEPPPVEPQITYSADIVWTEFGIPHITADDWGSLGYGNAYAYAQQNYCVIMKEYVRSNGESARYFGDEGNINADLIYKLFNDEERIDRLINEDLAEFVIDMLEGYAAGLNRYLEETGVDQLAEGEEGCRDAPWVREVDMRDIVRAVHKSILRGSSGPLANFAVAAQPQDAMARLSSPQNIQKMLASIDGVKLSRELGMPEGWELGSNAYAVGEEASQGNAGVLFGNPHFPWQGAERFFMAHLTMGDEYNVMGAALAGLPAPVIGFSENVAWSHTVSTATRFTFYELTLNPDNNMEYLFDGEIRALEPRTVSAEQMQADGSIETVEHTFYLSHFGPIVNLGTVSPLLDGWPNAVGTLLTYRDANLDNLRGLEQWVRMGQAADMDEFKEALRPIGIPWVNTIAAGRDGNAFYGDISVTPNVSLAQYGSCIRGTLQTLLTDNGFTTLDGSDSDCEWGNDEATTEGIFGYDSLPKLETREYGANANDSYWLSNPRNLLTGFSPVVGEEEVEQTLRTRATFAQAEERLAGTDGLGDPGFNVDNVRQMSYGARNYTAEQVIEDVVGVCQAVTDWSPYSSDTATVAQACSVLAAWDTRHLVDSVGAHVFWEFWQLMRTTENLWAIPFDAIDPVNTPRDLNESDAAVAEAIKQSLADAVAVLVDAGIPMDRPWGDVQFDEKNGVRYPIHGGSSSMMFSVITSSLVPGEGYSAIRHGNSYMQAVTWDETDCPDAYAMLTYSQSTDPASDHYADSTQLYANGGWIDMPFCEADRDAQEIRRETVSE
ncbi:MAG: penicillin acylase family protein [Halioglobus sp.]